VAAVALFAAKLGWVTAFSVHLIPVALLLLATPKPRRGTAVAPRGACGLETLEARGRAPRRAGDAAARWPRSACASRARGPRRRRRARAGDDHAWRAGVADRLADRDPGRGPRGRCGPSGRFRRSRSSSSARLLGVLARRRRARSRARASRPTCRHFPRLVDGLPRGGHGRRASTSMRPARPWPEVVAVAGYRIVQEALTNVAAPRRPRRQARALRLTPPRRAWSRSRCATTASGGRGSPWRAGGGLTGNGASRGPPALGGRFEAGGCADRRLPGLGRSLPVVAG